MVIAVFPPIECPRRNAIGKLFLRTVFFDILCHTLIINKAHHADFCHGYADQSDVLQNRTKANFLPNVFQLSPEPQKTM